MVHADPGSCVCAVLPTCLALTVQMKVNSFRGLTGLLYFVKQNIETAAIVKKLLCQTDNLFFCFFFSILLSLKKCPVISVEQLPLETVQDLDL